MTINLTEHPKDEKREGWEEKMEKVRKTEGGNCQEMSGKKDETMLNKEQLGDYREERIKSRSNTKNQERRTGQEEAEAEGERAGEEEEGAQSNRSEEGETRVLERPRRRSNGAGAAQGEPRKDELKGRGVKQVDWGEEEEETRQNFCQKPKEEESENSHLDVGITSRSV